MQKIKFNAGYILAILSFILISNTAQAQAKDSSKTKTATVVFSSTDMGCSTDSKMVETALYRKKGVKSVKINGDIITVVYYPSKTSTGELKTVIENTGTCEDPNAKVHKVKIRNN
jgi:copper chaperone CopZ